MFMLRTLVAVGLALALTAGAYAGGKKGQPGKPPAQPKGYLSLPGISPLDELSLRKAAAKSSPAALNGSGVGNSGALKLVAKPASANPYSFGETQKGVMMNDVHFMYKKPAGMPVYPTK